VVKLEDHRVSLAAPSSSAQISTPLRRHALSHGV
jgi:hypothetical protein